MSTAGRVEASTSLLNALRNVQRRTETTAGLWRLGLILLAALPLPLLVLIQLADDWLWAVIACCYLAGIALAVVALIRWLRWHIRQTLAGSDLALRLASGELVDDPIFELTPWPWRALLPGFGARSDLHLTLLRVAWNLDWYLGWPQLLWRIRWVSAPLAWIGAVAAGLHVSTNPAAIGAKPLLISLLGLLLLPELLALLRRQLWTEELVRHLRERLSA